MNNILNRMGEYNEVYDTVENKTKVCLTNCEDQINDLFVTKLHPKRKSVCNLWVSIKKGPLTSVCASYFNICFTFILKMFSSNRKVLHFQRIENLNFCIKKMK